MNRSILITALMLGALPAWAQNVQVFVVNEDGGVTQRPGNVSAQEAALALGEDAPPDGATGLVIERGEAPRWTTLSPAEIDKSYDGDGDPVVELFPEDEDPQKPIEIFPDEDDPARDPATGTNSGQITLNSGQWVGSLVNQSVTGCPPGAGEAVANQLGLVDGQLLPGTIDATFTPQKMYPDVDWVRTGPNGWTSDLRIGPAGIGTRVQRVLTLMTPDHINYRQQVNISGMGDCQVDVEVNFLQLGP